MSSIDKEDKKKEKKLSLGSIQSYKPLSRNASRLLEHMIDHAVERYRSGETTHIMHFNEAIEAFGLSATNDRNYIRDKVKEIQNLDVIQWDFLGEEERFLDSIKEMAREDLERVIQRPAFKSIVETEHFESINIERLKLKANKQDRTRAYSRLVDKILDLLFPLYVGNTKIFEAVDIHKSKISFSLNRHLADIFLNPSVYGILDRSINFLFRSPYSMRLYQNACVYRHLGETPWFTVDQSKMVFGIEKIENEEGELEFKHKAYSQFKRNVIKVAMNECNNFHDEGRVPFSIELEEDITVTPGKSVDRIRFLIRSDIQATPLTPDAAPILGVDSLLDENDLTITTSELMKVVDEMTSLKVKKPAAIEDVEHACAEHGATFEGLMRNIEYCKSQKERRRQIGGEPIKPGYVRRAIREGYVPYHSSPDDLTLGEGQVDAKKSAKSSDADSKSQKLEFIRDLFSFSEEVISEKETTHKQLLDSLSKRDSLLRTMLAMGTVTKEVVAERLLMLPDEVFERITGLAKQYQKHEVNDLLR